MKAVKPATLVALSIALIAAPSLNAQDDTGPLQSQERLHFDAGSGVVSAWNGVQVGPYSGTLVSVPGAPSITLYCIDFAHSVTLNAEWDVNTTFLDGAETDNSTMGNTRLGANTDSKLKYRKAAFLASLFDSYATTSLGQVPGGGTITGFDVSSERMAWSGLHAAIWGIIGPGFPDSYYGSSTSDDIDALANPWLLWVDAMANADPTFGGMDFSQWVVLSDVAGPGTQDPGTGRQEYLANVTVNPEPETWVLLFSGMLMLGFFARRRLSALG